MKMREKTSKNDILSKMTTAICIDKMYFTLNKLYSTRENAVNINWRQFVGAFHALHLNKSLKYI